MKTSLLALIFAIFTFSVNAADKIESAFGLHLGQTYEPKGAAVEVKKFGFDEEAFEFTPEKANPAFSTYLVFITPNSHLIYQIVAVGTTLEDESSRKLANQVIALIGEKYAEVPTANDTVQQVSRSVSVSHGQINSLAIVRTNADRPPRETFCAVTYSDNDLAKRATREKFENYQRELLKNADATGL